MKVKKLEIKGFKSFADKTTIIFNENITGIVGPNGCGKSNVVDSIRWVLGEQKTSQLRLEKMDNVLFNGTKNRKATSLAEVSLTFDNTKNILTTEFQEVTVTRKLYRTGDSEYRINDVSCRLKDIQNLFVDSGIGSDSYAIIELGMVDEILQNKENSRKKLFEQASSISKYKIRKKESLQKLKSTEENLERLQDLLAEIENNLKSLETQAKRAERFLQIKEEYKTYSLESFKIQVSNYKISYNNVYNNKQVELDKKNGMDANLSNLETNLQKLKLVQDDKEAKLSMIQKKFNEIINGLGKNENERNLFKEQISSLSKNSDILLENNKLIEVEKTDIFNSIQSLKNEIEQILKENAVNESQYESSKSKLNEIEQKFIENKNIVEQDKLQFSEIQKAVFELDKKSSILKSKIESNLSISEKNKAEFTQISENLTLKEKEFTLAEKEMKSKETALNNMLDFESKNNKEIEELNVSLSDKKTVLNQNQRKLDSKKNEYNLLKSMIDNLEGFPESIKFLKRNVSVFEAKEVFSDLINCQDEYKIALESIITPYANYFIVDTIQEAVSAIDKLKEHNVGKASFFILEILDKIPLPTFEIYPEFLSVLEVLETKDKYKKLMHLLFYNVYIAKENEPIDISKYQNKGIKIIEPNGTLIVDSWAISGGSKNLFDGAQVGRSKNLENLKKDSDALEKLISGLDKEIFKILGKLETLKSNSQYKEIEEARKSLASANEIYVKSKFTLEQFNTNMTQIKNQSTRLEEDIKLAQAEYDLIQKEYKSKEVLLVEIKNKNELNDAEFSNFLELFNKEKAAVNSIQVQVFSGQNLLKQKKQQLDFFENKISQLNQTILQNSNKISENEKDQKTKSDLLLKLEHDILSDYSNKEELDKEIQTTEKEYYSSKNNLVEQENAIKELITQRNRVVELITSYDGLIQDMRLELHSIKERLKIEFNIELDDFINTDLSTTMAKEDIDQKLVYIKKRIETYGEINPMAIETYNEMKERYTFLVEQKNDILQSKENLLETIKEIDQNAKERFLESFVKIRENFIKTFRILFTEDDDCDLILVDEANPIDSEIEIIAKPKGKKPVTINQLSGGEKTLTATALLFSLYLLKPAPFCIFDEVDAPLDDTNIAKFNRIIEEYSKNSQFIIVTHNKQTMSSVDVLYGVTMIEKGISKVVPVDFRTLQDAG